MLSLILISLKQNTSLLIEAQLKHGGHRKQGLRPTEALAAAGGVEGTLRASPCPPPQPLSCGPFPSPGAKAACRPCLRHPHCRKTISKGASGLIHTKRELGAVGTWPPASPCH